MERQNYENIRNNREGENMKRKQLELGLFYAKTAVECKPSSQHPCKPRYHSNHWTSCGGGCLKWKPSRCVQCNLRGGRGS